MLEAGKHAARCYGCKSSNINPSNITMTQNFRDVLESFDNQFPQRDYSIKIVCPEFTSVCPKTGQPDFGSLTFEYTPEKRCVELKALKMYLQTFRDQGIFYENVTNTIMDDFVAVVQPRKASLTAEFTPRGGISSIIRVEYPF
jgi:7-cyano-7-deazaguanine reductase